MIIRFRIYILVLLFLSLSLLAPQLSIADNSSFDLFFKSSSNYKDVVVKKVLGIDSFTILNKQRKRETIKLIGLQAPKIERKKTRTRQIKRNKTEFEFESNKNVSPLTPMDEIALDFVEELLLNQHIRIEFDINKKGEDNKTLGYVFLLKDNTFVNAKILAQGYSNLRVSPPNTKYKKILREAYIQARQEKRGFQSE